MKHIKKILLFLMLFSIKSTTAQTEFLEIEILDYSGDDGTSIGEMNIKICVPDNVEGCEDFDYQLYYQSGDLLEEVFDVPSVGKNYHTFQNLNHGWYTLRVSCDMELFNNDPTYLHSSIAWFWIPRLILSNLEEPIMNNHLTNINIYPNPFDAKTTINFQVSETTKTELSIYSIDGKLIQVLYDNTAEIGVNYAIPFDARSWTKGIYLLEMKTETGERKVEKLILN